MHVRILVSAFVGFQLLSAPAYGDACDDPMAVTAIKEQIICRGLVDCQRLGLTYSSLTRMTREDLRALLKKYVPKSDVSERFVDALTEINLNAREMFAEIISVPIDYKREIKRYECRAQVVVNREKLEVVRLHALWMEFFKRPENIMLLTTNPSLANVAFESWARGVATTPAQEISVTYGIVNGTIDISDFGPLFVAR